MVNMPMDTQYHRHLISVINEHLGCVHIDTSTESRYPCTGLDCAVFYVPANTV